MHFQMQTRAGKACSVNFSQAQCQMSEYKQEEDEALKSDRTEKMDNLPCGSNDSLRERSKYESHEKAKKQTQGKREIREK